jgi:hypothetical protein
MIALLVLVASGKVRTGQKSLLGGFFQKAEEKA